MKYTLPDLERMRRAIYDVRTGTGGAWKPHEMAMEVERELTTLMMNESTADEVEEWAVKTKEEYYARMAEFHAARMDRKREQGG